MTMELELRGRIIELEDCIEKTIKEIEEIKCVIIIYNIIFAIAIAFLIVFFLSKYIDI